MKKIIFTNISTAVGLTVVVLVSAFFGGLFLREARSFVDHGSGPGGSGAYATDLGVIGKPSQGISGTSTLFEGQSAIKAAVDGIGGGGVSWAGYTPSTYSGNLGQLKGANDKCEAGYSGSHWASYDEIMRLGAAYPWTNNAWVRDASQGLDVSGTSGVYVYNYKDGFGYVNGRPDYNCVGWSLDAPGSYYGPIVTDNSSAYLSERYTIIPKSCNLTFVLPCVY